MSYGIIVSSAGTSTQNPLVQNTLLSGKYPLLKLDTQNSKAFQTISLNIVTDTTEPSSPSWDNTYQVVYQFAHGYTYTPQVWALFQVKNPTLDATFYMPYFVDIGIIGSRTSEDSVAMYVSADSTNIYITVMKQNDGLGDANDLVGTSVNISVFTFVDDFSV